MTGLRPYKESAAPDAAFAVLADAARTGGALGVVASTVTAANGPPLHVHHGEDEYLLVLDGRLDVQVGDHRWSAGATSLVFCPRGVPHRYAAESDVARLLTLVAPAGLEDCLAGLAAADPTDSELLLGLAAEYGLQFLTPPFR
jgi:quercetin dioxygenase-like cupin family protein